MAKGPIITNETRAVIAKIYIDHRDWRAKEVQHEVNKQLKGKGPGLSAVQKELTKIRKSPSSPFDELWSLGSLVEYPIPLEAMPAVMSAYKKALVEKGELTIREAQWMARLYNVIDPPDLLGDWAWAYATKEWISKIINQPFNTEELDSKLISDIYYAQREHSESKRQTDIWGIAEKYSPWENYGAEFDKTCDLFNKLIDLNLSIEQTEEIAKSGKYKKETQNER